MSNAVRFEIDRLTLHGFTPADKNRFLGTLQAQLTELGKSGEIKPGSAAAQITTRIQAAAPSRS